MRVLHLVGSPTTEFFAELSRLYAAGALQALRGDGREHVVAHVAPDGTWTFPADLTPAAIAEAPALALPAAVERLTAVAPDVAVPQLFCVAGMTTYRSLLDVLGIPFVGNRAETMAIGAHKPHARALVAAAGVPVAEARVLRRGEHPDLPLPVVVKPAAADNSSGVTLVREPGELDAALAAASAHGDEVLVERFVELGREVRCGVLERDGELVCLPLEEYAVDADSKPIRDEADKLRRADGELELVAKDAVHASIVPVDDPVTEVVWAAARTAHRALGCRHYSLFDFRVDPAGRPVFLEASLYCSYSPSSVLAVMAAAAGIGVAELFAEGVARATATAR